MYKRQSPQGIDAQAAQGGVATLTERSDETFSVEQFSSADREWSYAGRTILSTGEYRSCLFYTSDKLKYITEYQNRQEAVCMIGDGINDAPALKAADVGLSLIHI